MHPVLGTMMPEICEAPHLSVFPIINPSAPVLMREAFISFSIKVIFKYNMRNKNMPSFNAECLIKI